MALREDTERADRDLLRAEMRHALVRVGVVESRMSLLEEKLRSLSDDVLRHSGVLDTYGEILGELQQLRDVLQGGAS